MTPGRFDAIVLAGGRAARLGGIDKPAEPVGGRSLVGRVLDALDGAARILVVGGAPASIDAVASASIDASASASASASAQARVRAVVESPPGRGPVHAVAAALPGVTSTRVALLAADLPFLTAAALDTLRAGLDQPGPDAVLALDDRGQDQFLLAMWDTTALRAAVAGLGGTVDRPVRALYGRARVRRVSLAGFPPPWWDCDTADDLATARAWTSGPGRSAGVGEGDRV